MTREELIIFIKSNLKNIHNAFSAIFGLDKSEFQALMINLIKAFEFNENLNEKDYSADIFSPDNLLNLKDFLTKMALSDVEIKQIIVKSPIILLYSNELQNIYLLYKAQKCYGYTILDNGQHRTYLLNNNIPSNVVDNNYVTDQMLAYYNVKEFDNKEFDKIEKNFKLKNYYFKKKR